MNVGICQQMRLKEKGKDLLMTAGLLRLPACFLSREMHPQPFQSLHPWGLALLQADSAGGAGPGLQPWCLWYATLLSL